MFQQAGRGAGVHIADEADLQRDTFIENVLCQIAQLHRLALRNGYIVDQAGAMADAMRSTVLNGLPDGLFSVAFACMDGDVEILALNVVESIDVFFGRVAAFFTGKIETHYAALPEIDGELRHLQRHIHVAHSADNQSGRHPEVFTAPLQSLQYSRDHLLMGQSLTGMKYRRETGFKINYA